MTFRHLKVFLEVCKCKNMTTAARNLFMTQPAVSQTIKELEINYNVVLFERLHNQIFLTDKGALLYQHATHLVGQVLDLEQLMKNSELTEKIRIGMNLTVAATIMVPVLKLFLDQYPNVKPKIYVLNGTRLKTMLEMNELDFIILEDLALDHNLIKERLFNDRICIVCTPDHHLAEKEVSVSQLAEEKLFLRNSGAGARNQFEQLMNNLGYPISPTIESDNVFILIKAALAGLGVAILPYRVLENQLQTGKLVELSVKEMTINRDIVLAYHKTKYLSKPMKSFISLCKEQAVFFNLSVTEQNNYFGCSKFTINNDDMFR